MNEWNQVHMRSWPGPVRWHINSPPLEFRKHMEVMFTLSCSSHALL